MRLYEYFYLLGIRRVTKKNVALMASASATRAMWIDAIVAIAAIVAKLCLIFLK